jgi:spermidine synthase
MTIDLDDPASARRTPSALGILFACFFLSGATGLIYEVVWLRLLGLVFGHTVYAITAVLAAFMAGLGLGSYIFARQASQIRNLIRAYCWLEIGIGVYCSLIPLLLGLASSVYLGLYASLGLSYSVFGFVQFLIVFVLLLIPTMLMGGTLPLLSQALVGNVTGLGRTVGVLYALNTLGAMVGVAIAGYLLIPALGNRGTIAMAAISNVAIGLLALAYSRTGHLARGPVTERASVQSRTMPLLTVLTRPAPGTRLTVVALGISGAASMLYEVAWTRALTLVIGSSTYAFTAMLVAFLLGIAGGSALFAWLWGKRPASAGAFAVLQAGVGIVVGLTLLFFDRMPELFLAALRWSDTPIFVQIVQLAISASALLLSTLLIGASFPCAVAVVARDPVRLGRDVGEVYVVNTVGAIVGTVLAGFVLIPAIGVHSSIKVGIVTNLLLAAGLFTTLSSRWRWAALGPALATAAILFIPSWNQSLMSSGLAIYGKLYLEMVGSGRLSELLQKQNVLFYRDGISGTVCVLREGENFFLRINGKTDASTGRDMPTQLMSGHLPLLLHPDPRSVLVIGLGSGITAGAAARHAVTRLDIVEIEPAVVEAAQFFAREHRNVLQDPRVHMAIADGRNFLLTTAERYDVIISEPSNPWIGGLAALFSVEFFQLARQRLQPGGIMLQWLQGYSLYPEDLRMVVRTFRAVFPATSIWNTTRGDFLLMGRVDSGPLDLSRIKARYGLNRGISEDLNRIRIGSWAGLLGYFMLDERDAAQLAEGAGLNTDDRLPLEFSAPRALYVHTVERNWRLMRTLKVAEFPDVTPDSRRELDQPEARYWVGVTLLRRDALEDALSQFERALQLDPGHTASMLPAAVLHLRLGRPAQALTLARRMLSREPMDSRPHFVAAFAAAALHGPAEAIAPLERAFALDPQNGEIRTTLNRVRTAVLRQAHTVDADMTWLLP